MGTLGQQPLRRLPGRASRARRCTASRSTSRVRSVRWIGLCRRLAENADGECGCLQVTARPSLCLLVAARSRRDVGNRPFRHGCDRYLAELADVRVAGSGKRARDSWHALGWGVSMVRSGTSRREGRRRPCPTGKDHAAQNVADLQYLRDTRQERTSQGRDIGQTPCCHSSRHESNCFDTFDVRWEDFECER